MPEGHKIHRLARDQSRLLAGERLSLRSPQGRFAEGAAELDGRTLGRIEARGKHLLYHFEGDRLLHVHLGLYGKFRAFKDEEPEVRGQVRVAAACPVGGFHLVGPNQCDLWTPEDAESLRGRLGPDPLAKGDKPDRMVERISASRAAIGGLLLDQSVVAGVGNIYRADVLFLLGIHPLTPGRDVAPERLNELWTKLRELLRLGVKYDRIITADPAVVGKPYGRMRREERLLIYKAERCPRCGGPVETHTVAARRVDACPKCQPLE